MAKKQITPGLSFTVGTKKNEHKLIIEWLNVQSNLSDSIRYLIEQDIIKNGVRNLQQYIPSERLLFDDIEDKKDISEPVKKPMNVTISLKAKEDSTAKKTYSGVDDDVVDSWS